MKQSRKRLGIKSTLITRCEVILQVFSSLLLFKNIKGNGQFARMPSPSLVLFPVQPLSDRENYKNEDCSYDAVISA